MANTLTCPMPQNINPLSNSGFILNITRLPGLTYFQQSVNLPSVNIPQIKQANPFVDASIPGDKLTFDQLTVQFLVDENMENYTAIWNWMKGLGFPDNNEEYIDLLNYTQNTNQGKINERLAAYSDGTLSILGSNLATVKQIEFRDLHPISLSINTQFDATVTETTYVTGTVVFDYTSYDFV